MSRERESGEERGPVLAACSLSEEDGAVARTAARAARALGVELRLVHLLRPSDGAPRGGEPGSRERAREAAGDRLEALADELSDPLAGGAVRTSVLEGVPHRGVAAVAEEAAAGLIVLGAKAHADASPGLLGSTAERVVRRGVAPTLVVRGEPHAPLRRVLATVDFSPVSIAALEEGLSLLGPLSDAGTEVRLLFAVSPFQGAVGEREVDYDDAMAVSREELERLAARLDDRFPGTVGARVERGFPRELILAEAGAFGADAITLGSHGRGGFERLLLGSVAEHVLRHAPCSVLVVPSREPGQLSRQRPTAV